MEKLKPGDSVLFSSSAIIDENVYILVAVYPDGKCIIRKKSIGNDNTIWDNNDVHINNLSKII